MTKIEEIGAKKPYIAEPMRSIDKKRELIREKACKGASDTDFEVFMHVVEKTGLDPLMNQIYAVGRNSNVGGIWTTTFTPQTSIDGLRIIADKTGCYSPGEAPKYTYDTDNNILYAEASVKKQTKDGTWHIVSSQAFWAEYVQLNKEGSPSKFWKKFPHLMLAKCAEALALRKAFPAELCNLYTADEMAQSIVVDDSAEPLVDPIKKEEIKVLFSKISENEGFSILKAFGIDTIEALPANKLDSGIAYLKKRLDVINRG